MVKVISNKKTKVDLSLIITTFNEEKYLPILLESIIKQKSDISIEIIVIDDKSTDNTLNIAKKYHCLIKKNHDKANVTKMRNIGLKAARGTVIIFCDADVAFSSNFIKEMAEPIIDGIVDITLCFWFKALESKFPILPEKHSKSYATYLKFSPFLTRSPIRVLPWFGRWIKSNITKKGYTNLSSIPDRVHTTAIAVRTTIPKGIGHHALSKFGAHNDTEYCLNAFSKSDKISWKYRPLLYVSERRYFPENFNWIFKKLFGPIYKIFKIDKKNKSKKGGFKNPKGVR